MEGVIKRLWVLAVLLVVTMAILTVTHHNKTLVVDEHWMEQHLPAKVGDYEFIPINANDGSSYRMDERTYKLLQPYGIVARTFSHANEGFDAVVIASDSKESFHDPQICFSAQGFTIQELGDVNVDTKSRGTIPVKLVRIGKQGSGEQLAAYTYKGPGGFYSSPKRLALAMMIEPLKGGYDTEGVFYRFIPEDSSASKEKLLEFIAAFMDAAKETSSGFF